MLTLKTKTVRFEWTDDDVESVVTLSSEDDEAGLLRKLKRVIALAEGEQALPVRQPGATLPPMLIHPATDDTPPQTGNGWAAMMPPEVPARLENEVELIRPGEDE